MSVDYDEIESLRFEREDQVRWWKNNGDDLDTEQRDDLVEWIVSRRKFNYFDLLIEITVDNIERPEDFGHDLERISPNVDNDLAWGQLTRRIRERIEEREQLAEEIYEELIQRDDGWVQWVGGVALGHCEDEFVRDEAPELLSSEDSDDVSAGLQAIWIQSEDFEEFPDIYIEAFEELSNREDDKTVRELIGLCSDLVEKDPILWDIVADIGRDSPDKIPYILRVFSLEIDDDNLEDYLELLKTGIESDQSIELPQISYHLHSRFSHRVDTLAAFIVWLSDHDLYQASRIAKEIAEENNEFWEVLVERRDEFSNRVFAKQVLDNTATFVDEEIQELRWTLDAAFHEEDPNEKGELLEDAAEQFVDLVEGFQTARNVESTEEEIDIMVHNRRSDMIQYWDSPILIECRNRKSPVAAKDVRDFAGKMLNQPTETGFFVARNGFSAGAEEQVQNCLSWPQSGVKVAMVPMGDLLKLTDSGEIPSLLRDKYDKIYE